MQDQPGQQARFPGPGRGHDHDVLIHRDTQRMPVLRPAQQQAMPRRMTYPLPRRQRPAGPPGPAERREPPPPQPQLPHGRVAPAGVQPQPQPDPQVPDPEPRQPAMRQQAPAD